MHLGAGQPVPSRKDYWGDALSSLEKYKQSRIKQELLNKEDLISWPDIIAGICRREQDGRQKKERKLRFAGREIDLRKMMDSWTEFLDKIKQIGDVAVNADPIHAGLPWAAVRFILTVSAINSLCSAHDLLWWAIAVTLHVVSDASTGRNCIKRTECRYLRRYREGSGLDEPRSSIRVTARTAR